MSAQKNAAELDRYFTALYNSGKLNGNILVAEKGKIVYRKSFGYSDYSSKKLNTAGTVFPVASITKTITSVAVLQLWERGKFRLSDRFQNYFPDFPYSSVTIKELLSHTSRIPSSAFYAFLDSVRKTTDTFFTNADVIPTLIKMNKPLSGEAKQEGDRSFFSYSNVNYYLLCLLIEKLSGMPYNSYLKKYIFIPAGMKHSSLSEFYFGLDKDLCKEHRWHYIFSEQPEQVDTTSENAYIFKTYNFKGHGDVVTTTDDLLKYDRALRNNILLKASTQRLAYTPVVPGTSNSSGYGLGWSVFQDSSKMKVVMHHGGGIGIQAMFIRNLSDDQTVIYFDNMNNYSFNTAFNALKILNGEKVEKPKKSIARFYGRIIEKGNIPDARSLLQKLMKDSAHYNLYEDDMNLLGYQFLWQKKNDKAFEVLKTNVDLFPASWNSYDSFGEILLIKGQKEEALKMYRKSVEMNPENEGGKKAIESILKGN